jgi:uncharacterized protein YjlB
MFYLIGLFSGLGAGDAFLLAAGTGHRLADRL